MQANASSVETDLGGGNYGYLGLVLNNTEYATIPHTQPFILPNYLDLLAIAPTLTPIQVLELKDAYQK